MSGSALLSWRGEERLEDLDMADVIGMADTRYSIEVAAAGGHHLMLTGPKGSGKTTLAERIPGLLPDLTDDESLELTAVHSLCGALPPGASRLTRPPFRAPHHSASRAGILGGGSGRVRPGDVSKAHLGVLFLDEFPLFPRDVVEALREPLEAGEISISRGEEDATYPARTMFVFAQNPCPCGEFHPYSRDHHCTCREVKRREYRAKISGPIADRIDITRFVEPLSPAQRGAQDLPFDRPESSASIRVRVTAARLRQRERYAGMPWRLNAHVPGPALRDLWPLTDEAASRLDVEVYSGRLTRRGAVRVHRVAWSVADLTGVPRPGIEEVDVALRLRSATPLRLASVTMRGAQPGGVGVSVPDEAERLARVLLSRIGEPGDPRLTDLVHELGATRVLTSLRAQAADRELGADLAERLESTDPARELERAAAMGIRFVVPGDEEWPACLDDLAHAPHLHERGGVPVGLWCRGSLRLDEATEHGVAVVGSRSATTYGADVATGIATILAGQSWSVLSGAAYGIDQAAHRGALAARGKTVAVLACGADRAYPAAHRNLIDYIADVGLVVSEAAPGCAPTRIRFLARNRIIAAAARGVVVVEAAVRSGALNTASWAAGLGRTVMAVPGPVTSAPSAGSAPADPRAGRPARHLGGGGPRGRRPDGRLRAGRPARARECARPAVEPGAAGARCRPAGARRRLRLDRSHRRSRAHPHQGSPAGPAPRRAGRALTGALAARDGASGDPLRVEETG